MASMDSGLRPALANGAHILRPLRARWNALEPGTRRLLAIGAVLLGAGVLVAFVWLPAVRTRDALTVRLPQLEARLAQMRSQASEVKALALVAPNATPPPTIADVPALQSVFGPDAQVTATGDGFRIVIPALEYARWWDKTGDALGRYGLALRAAALTRAVDTKAPEPVVAVDMQLARGTDAAAAAAARPDK